jgi:hypothetical protein
MQMPLIVMCEPCAGNDNGIFEVLVFRNRTIKKCVLTIFNASSGIRQSLIFRTDCLRILALSGLRSSRCPALQESSTVHSGIRISSAGASIRQIMGGTYGRIKLHPMSLSCELHCDKPVGLLTRITLIPPPEESRIP